MQNSLGLQRGGQWFTGLQGLRSRRGSGLCCAFLVLSMSACSPALDWRDARLAGAGLLMLLPCKPQVQDRSVEVQGQPWSATLMACDAAGMTFAALALQPTQAPEPGVMTALGAQRVQDLVRSAPDRWGPLAGDQAAPPSVKLPAGAQQAQWSRHTRAAPGAAATHTLALFMATPQGLVQLSVHGQRLDESAIENFFGQLKVSP
ncbi:MAG: hypothetical protein ACKOJ7_06345 [Betaproteobacteria bacterium]